MMMNTTSANEYRRDRGAISRLAVSPHKNEEIL